MKRLLPLLVLCISLSGFAQNWAPFPLDVTSEWRVSKTWLSSPCVVNQRLKYYIAEDTILNGNYYNVIRFSGEEFPTTGPNPHPSCESLPQAISGFKTAMRAENGKYFISSNGIDEQVLFDFTLGTGDQMEGLVIDSIDNVDVDGENCKRLWVNNDGPFWIVEGVGHSNGMFESLFDGISYLSDLLCYSENNAPVVFGSVQSCDMTVGLIEQAAGGLRVSPNPSSGTFRIETPKKSTYRIYDLFGRIVRRGNLEGPSGIDLSAEPDGIYLIVVQTENGISSTKLIKQ